MRAPRVITGTTHRDAFYSALREVLGNGEVEETRNGVARSLRNATIFVQNAWPPNINAVKRNSSLVAQLAETVWILGGSNDARWLETYLPRALDFSDDGETWRGGYGPRLRKWQGGQNGVPVFTDQLSNVVNLLNSDPYSRRAVMNIFDPAVDQHPGKDIPCNNWLHFDPARDNKLHLTVAIRSNDLFWGWSGINTFEWPVLLALVAHLTGKTVGSVTYNIANLHIYEPHWSRAETVLENAFRSETEQNEFPTHVSQRKEDMWAPENLFSGIKTIEDLDAELEALFNIEKDFPKPPRFGFSAEGLSPFFRVALDVMWAHHKAKEQDPSGFSLFEVRKIAPSIHVSRYAPYGKYLARSFDLTPQFARQKTSY